MIAGAESEFLNIKQAAAFLNVSEVSLRRWTNAGSLGCLRVGAKRERRFRREDLIAFMVSERETAAPPLTPAGAVLEGIRVEPGTHLCATYRNDRGRLKLAVPFLADGLAAGQACFLVAGSHSRQRILERLRQSRRQCDADVKAGRLILSDGGESPDSLCEDLADRAIDALHAGAGALRILGDMTWHRDHGLDDHALMQFETMFERTIARRFPVVALCQYDARLFAGTAILDALDHHQDTFRYPAARFLG